MHFPNLPVIIIKQYIVIYLLELSRFQRQKLEEEIVTLEECTL